MKIGWTLNVVIMEAELTRDARKWYLEQAEEQQWPKTQLLNAVLHKEQHTDLEKLDTSEQQISQAAMEYSVLIVEVVRNVHPNNDLFEKVLCKQQGIKFRGSLFLSIHSESRLDIELAVSIVDNKIDFLLRVGAPRPIRYDPDVHRVSPPQKFVINEVFHDMTRVILPVIQPCIPKTDVGIVILVRIVEIRFALDIISLCYGNQKRIDDVLYIVGNERRIDLLVFHTGDCIGDVGGIRQGADLRGKEVQNVIENIFTLNAVSLNDVFHI